MIKCANCEYGDPTYKHQKNRQTGERIDNLHKIECSKPEYKGRKYDVKPKSECDSYMKRDRNTTPEQGV